GALVRGRRLRLVGGVPLPLAARTVGAPEPAGGRRFDSVVVGAGPDGLAAALTLAQAGRAALVLEACDTPGGGARTAALTLPGFVHDVCSAVHPLAVTSPFLRRLPLAAHGLQ